MIRHGRRDIEDKELIKKARELLAKLKEEGGVITAEDLRLFELLLDRLREMVEKRKPPEKQEGQ